MTAAVFITAIWCLLMAQPYLPGRFDASAAALSFVAQTGSYASLLLMLAGSAWMISPRRSGLWRRLAITLGGLITIVVSIAAAAVNQLSIGLILGVCATFILGRFWAGSRHMTLPTDGRTPVPSCLVLVPIILVAFQIAVVPRMAEWSRDRAIRHSAPLIAEIESFRQRRGHYPLSLHSLNPDVPTGIIGVERFQYEPNGESYNLFFVRPHTELDAAEVVLFNPRGEHRFTSHELDILQYDGEHLDLRRGDRRRTPLAHAGWVSIVFD